MEREPTGWIKIDRNLLDWRWARHPITFLVWMHLLLRANYKDVDVGNDVVKRGEVYVPQDLLASDIGITKKQLRTAIKNLKDTGEIRASKKIGKVVVISIPNYDKYQGEGQRKGNERASERTSKGQHIKKDKNIKNTLSLTLSHKPYAIPTIEEVREYERTSGLGKDPDLFYKHYSAEGWKAQGKKIYSWQRLYDNWQMPEIKLVQNRPKRFTDADGITYEWVNGNYEKVRK